MELEVGQEPSLLVTFLKLRYAQFCTELYGGFLLLFLVYKDVYFYF